MASIQPNIAHSFTVRAEYANEIGMLAQITSVIGFAGGDLGAMDIADAARDVMVRDITINARDEEHSKEIVKAITEIDGVRIINVSDEVFLRHLGGKIEMNSKMPIKTRNDISIVYTPGVARVSSAIHENPDSLWTLTSKGNTVAVVTDGSAVLGLGDIGPGAALPVMEGKAQLLKELAGIDAWPIVLDTNDTDEIVKTVKHLSPGFGGINLEDIAAPRCFEIEKRLTDELDIPVFHDDQHGTAVVVLAALLNALKVVEKNMEDIKIVIVGIGAAGIATTNLLIKSGATNIIGVDKDGIIHRDKDYGDQTAWATYAKRTNPTNLKGGIEESIEDADVFIGLSAPGVISVGNIRTMKKDPIVLAMSNPDPEVWPEEAQPYVKVMATGRSDYPNQVNNALCFPGMFKGLLQSRAKEINDEMKIAAAEAIASRVPDRLLSSEYVVPSIFDKTVVRAVARGVSVAARGSGVSRR